MNGIELITQERKEQIEKHGFGDEHDAEHDRGELLDVVIFCILGDEEHLPGWVAIEKLKRKIFEKDRVGQLTIAGALIAAEIDRIKKNSDG